MVVIAGTISMRRPGMLSRAAIAAIGGYQRYISPHKGFRCAHRVLHGRESCSEYIKQLVAQVGFIRAMRMMHVRFRECGAAYRVLQARKLVAKDEGQARQSSTSNQDRACDGADDGICDAAFCVTEGLSCIADLGCGAVDVSSCGAADCGAAALPCGSMIP